MERTESSAEEDYFLHLLLLRATVNLQFIRVSAGVWMWRWRGGRWFSSLHQHNCVLKAWEGGRSPADRRRRVCTPKDVTQSPGCDEINSKTLSETVWAPRGREPTERVVLLWTDAVTLRYGRTNSFNIFWWVSWYFKVNQFNIWSLKHQQWIK